MFSVCLATKIKTCTRHIHTCDSFVTLLFHNSVFWFFGERVFIRHFCLPCRYLLFSYVWTFGLTPKWKGLCQSRGKIFLWMKIGDRDRRTMMTKLFSSPFFRARNVQKCYLKWLKGFVKGQLFCRLRGSKHWRRWF